MMAASLGEVVCGWGRGDASEKGRTDRRRGRVDREGMLRDFDGDDGDRNVWKEGRWLKA